jgi:endonuclease YncB( thermonuclease family)
MGCINTVPLKEHTSNLFQDRPLERKENILSTERKDIPENRETKDIYQTLVHCTYQNTPPFTPTFTEAKVVKIYDGDTLHVVALIEGKPHRFMIRMYGYDSPELKSKDPNEKSAAIKARDFLASRINGKIVNVKIYPIKEKFGRILADLSDQEGVINSWMIKNGHGKPYFGGTKEGFSGETSDLLDLNEE